MRNIAVVSFVFITVNASSAISLGQFIHFDRNENGEVESADYQGSADWLAAQKDEKAQLHKLPKLESLQLINHVITRQELEYVARLKQLKYLSIGAGYGCEAVEVKGSLSVLTHLHSLEELELGIAGLKDSDLSLLKEFENLNYLHISEQDLHGRYADRKKLTDAAAIQIAAAQSLEDVCLWDPGNYSDLFILRLSKMPNLRGLKIDSKKFTNTALDIIAMNCQLRDLDITSPQFTDEGVEFLGKMQSLESLQVRSPHITNRVFRSLKPLELLREITLPIDIIEKKDFEVFANMKSLEVLNLPGASFGDAEFAVLKNHPSLNRIIITKSTLTERSIEVFESLENLESVFLSSSSRRLGLQKIVDKIIKQKQ